MCSYPTCSKWRLNSVVFPIAGHPTNKTRWGLPSERGGGTRGVEVGTKGGPAKSNSVIETSLVTQRREEGGTYAQREGNKDGTL